MYGIRRIAIAAAVAAALASPVLAQQRQQDQNYSAVSLTDIQRLQDSAIQAGTEVQALRAKDATGRRFMAPRSVISPQPTRTSAVSA